MLKMQNLLFPTSEQKNILYRHFRLFVELNHEIYVTLIYFHNHRYCSKLIQWLFQKFVLLELLKCFLFLMVPQYHYLHYLC